MKRLSFSYSNALNFLSENEIKLMHGQGETAVKILEEKSGAGNDFLGWVDLPTNYDKVEFDRIKLAAEKIKSDSEILIVIGIGGSYLGARAAIEFLSHSFYNNLPKDKRKGPEIYFAGQNISGKYITDLLEMIGDRDYSVNVISKSGTTTEPAIAFRIFKKHLEEKYGVVEARKRIYATTDSQKGALKKLATDEGYETFTVPDDVGGRFSVLTAVGLLPIAAAGISIDDLMAGAKEASEHYKAPLAENDCYKYAIIRNILNRKGKDVELLINYEPRLHYIGEWWKQLFGESEGKDQRGIFPAAADFSTDLHSLGQFIQDGKRVMFETLISIDTPDHDIIIEEVENDLDGLNYLAGKGMDFVNKKAADGTILAHVDGGVPNLEITIPEASAFQLGYLFYFFEKACAVSGYILGINPFNQPGVEAYKANMFALLGKPGFEEQAKELNSRLKK
ncbi:MAG: glucose-6-phosphate isomerase [Cetobacterium sp.]|uniref:glucose-6-phosphate isomerase n=1 Tax=unclassified Cetobacterium TaxID=2630983 RepID=UPI00163CF123|nr:glucose-6-phosphate isomerase [Cetobacterium sp. 2A]MBC2856205.1 glucose-6-phosphate isomerase [Cetobacterium sp. 2A]